MGIYSGGISLCRYQLVGVKTPTLKLLNEKLKTYKAGPLRWRGSADGKEEQIGWTLPHVQADDEDESRAAEWDMSDCQFDQGFFLRLRLDRRKVSAELLQLAFRSRLNEVNSGRDKPLSRKSQKTLKEEVKAELFAQALPNISYVDAYWEDGGQILLFSTGKKNREAFEELFTKTFVRVLGGRLLRMDPPLLGLSRTEWEDETPHIESLRRLVPLPFLEHSI